MTENQLDVAEKLYLWVLSISSQKDNDAFHKIPIQSLISNFNGESIPSLILHNDINNNMISDVLFKKCKKDLIKTASAYQMILIYNCKIYQDEEEVQSFYNEYFNAENPDNLIDAITKTFYEKNLPKKSLSKLMVYTYDDIMEDIKDIIEIKAPYVNYYEIKMGIFISEKDLRKELGIFFKNDKDLLVIRLEWKHEHKYISLLNSLINKMTLEQNNVEKSKHFCVIIHMEIELISFSKFNTLETINYLAGWEQYTIDTLKGKNLELLKELMGMTSKELIKSGRFFKLCKFKIIELMHKVLFRFKYTSFLNTEEEKLKISPYLDRVLKKLEELPEKDKLWDILKQKINEGVNMMSIPDWKLEIIANKELAQKNHLPINILENWSILQLERPLSQILLFIEKNSSLES